MCDWNTELEEAKEKNRKVTFEEIISKDFLNKEKCSSWGVRTIFERFTHDFKTYHIKVIMIKTDTGI